MSIRRPPLDRKSTRLNSSHTVIYTLSLHDALPICERGVFHGADYMPRRPPASMMTIPRAAGYVHPSSAARSEEHTSELQSHRDLHSFPTRRSSDLRAGCISRGGLYAPPPAC